MRPGYKQTEVGVIPEDWEVAKLGELIDYRKGYAFKSKEYTGDGIRIIRVSDTTYDSILDTTPVFVPLNKASQYAQWKLRENDLVVSTVGSKPPMYESMVGKVIIVKHQHDGALLNQNAVLIRDRKKRTYFQQILLNHFRSKRYLLFIESIFRGNANQASITLNELFDYSIPFPCADTEQRAIAAALSDVDGLLAKLDQLIAKKRDLKQAAMQQLLTGQTRLPGFSREWEVKRLGDVLHVRHGKSQHHIIANDGQYPILATGGEIGRTNTCLYNKPSVLIGRKGTIDKPQYRDDPFWTVDTLFYTDILGGTSAKFIFYKFNMINWRSYNEASGVPSLNASTIENIEIKLPKSEEQTAIAAVLSDMDTEIAAMVARRDKTRALKQGMMQELLTGRIRLV